MLSRITSLPAAEQRSALRAVLDDDWTRMLRYGLGVEDGADLKTTHIRQHGVTISKTTECLP